MIDPGVAGVAGVPPAGRSGREYPGAPIVGVAGVVLDRGGVLLIRRGREPMKGAWSLPGGALEVGETMAQGVEREVMEETGLAVEAIEVVATLDRIVRDDNGRVRYHYVLVDLLCQVVQGGFGAESLVAGDDAEEAMWVMLDALDGKGMEEAAVHVIEAASQRARVLGVCG